MSSKATAGSGLLSKKSSRKPHLTQAEHAGALGEIAAVRNDMNKELSCLAGIVVEEFTDVPAAATTGFKTSTVTSTSAQAYTGTALDGTVGTGKLTPPRNVSVTAADSAASYAGSVTFKGYDVDGKPISEAVAITNNATAVGAKMFAQVTEIDVPAQVDANGHLSFGFSTLMGLKKTIKTRAGAVFAMKEVVAGSVVTTGTLTDAATHAPHGAYSSATAPNDTNDYCIMYEADFTA